LEHLSTPADPAAQEEVSELAEGITLRDILAQTERRVIAEALRRTEWNRTRAAEQLGISRRQLFDKIRQYHLEP